MDEWTELDQQRADEDRDFLDGVLAGSLDDEWDYDDEPVFDAVEEIALEEADRHLESRAFHLRRIAQAERVAAAAVARVQARADVVVQRATERHGPRAEWHEGAVAGLHEALLRRDSKRKSIELPHGVLRSRSQAKKITYDAKVTLPWLIDNNPDLVRAKPVVERSVIKAALDAAVEAGAVIPGVATEPAWTKYTIEDPS